MVFELNNSSDFDSSTYFSENNPVNTSLDNPDLQIITNEISSSNPPTQNVYEDPFLLASSFSSPIDHSFYINNNELMTSSLYNELKSLIESDTQHHSPMMIETDGNKMFVNFEGFYFSNSENSSSNENMIMDHDVEVKRNKKNKRKSNGTKGNWDKEEDRLLVELVKELGTRRWSYIAEKMDRGREGKQLRERYNNHLRSGLKKEAWSEKEDLKLIEAHKKLGNRWIEIAKMLPGRSENDIKNKYNAAKRRCLNAMNISSHPKSSSIFVDYVNNYCSKADQKSTVESNTIVGREDNGGNNEQLVADGSNGMYSCFDPNELSDNVNGGNNEQGLADGWNELSFSFDPIELSDYDDNGENNEQVLADGSNEMSSSFDINKLTGNNDNSENNEQVLADGSNRLSFSFDPSELSSYDDNGGKNENNLADGLNRLSSSFDPNELASDDDNENSWDWDIFMDMLYK